jgi:CheY-like chemotaxis protein
MATRKSLAPGAAKQTSKAPPPMRTVLVVEDDVALRTMVARALATHYCVEQAEDGLAALERLCVIEPPSLILLDIMMPRVDGLTLARKLKEDPKLRSVPVIFVTAKDTPRDLVAGLGVGAKHYLTKPFSIATLLEKVDKFAK